ncbi:hypothetical protein BJ875DRAFT_484386 [Amylocarpus encephaloides]|uniref:Uncharacterized protein n=1 Tax=Amylocarpus encephaloides TaxID=45428 RepID=A0A9P7YJH6_9HELO|nr:hypothetical protein BJ875DRAFT_484386 [Amylocarpus encephaloides]
MDQYFSGASVSTLLPGASDPYMGILSTAHTSRSHPRALAKVPYRSTKFKCEGMLNFRHILNRSNPQRLYPKDTGDQTTSTNLVEMEGRLFRGLRGLRWSSHGTKRAVEFSTAPPSWFWAYLFAGDQLAPHEVYISDYEDHLTNNEAEVINIEVENEEGDVFGQVRSAALTLNRRSQYVDGHGIVPALVLITREHIDAGFRWGQGQNTQGALPRFHTSGND